MSEAQGDRTPRTNHGIGEGAPQRPRWPIGIALAVILFVTFLALFELLLVLIVSGLERRYGEFWHAIEQYLTLGLPPVVKLALLPLFYRRVAWSCAAIGGLSLISAIRWMLVGGDSLFIVFPLVLMAAALTYLALRARRS